MASRLFWIFLTGAALVTGIAIQERDWLFGFGSDGVVRVTERSIEGQVERAVERSFDRMRVVDSDGRQIDVDPGTKRQLGDAVRRLVSAEAELALMQIRGGGGLAEKEASARRDAARADVERLKNTIERQEQLSERDRELMREQIQQQVRETIRSAVRP